MIALSEKLPTKRLCGDCQAAPGELHHPGCDVERCVLCGGQAISCNCAYEVNGMSLVTLETTHPEIYEKGPTQAMLERLEAEEEKYGGRLPWTGEWPGVAECREFDWWCKWVDGKGWVRCTKEDPVARTDLNRLNAVSGEVEWSREKRRWVRTRRGGGS